MGVLSFVFLINIVLVLSKPIYIKNDKIEEHNAVITETPEIEHLKVVNLTERNAAVFVNQIRPGMTVNSYAIELEIDDDGDSFNGIATIQVSITDATTNEDPVKFYLADLDVNSVMFSILGGSNLNEANFDVDDGEGILEIDPGFPALSYTFVIEYTGSLEGAGKGLYLGHYGDK